MILSRVRLIPQQRYDLETFIGQQSGVRTDNKFYTKQFLSSESFIVKGFGVSGLGLTEAIIEMDNATLIFGSNTSDFSWFTAEESPTDITIAEADLQPGAKNYVELYLVTENNTPVTAAFWDPAANSGAGAEFNQEIDTMTDLSVAVDIRTGGFSGSPDRIPLAIIETDGSSNIVGIRDKRNLLYRSGTNSDVDNKFTWVSQEEPEITLVLSSVVGTFTEGESITFSGGAIGTVSLGGTTTIKMRTPDSDSFSDGNTVTGGSSGATAVLDTYLEEFTGADKDISNQRDLILALQTEITALKGTRFWYQNAFNSNNGLSNQINSIMVQNVLGASYSWDGSNFSISDGNVTPDNADELARLQRLGSIQQLLLTRQDGTGSSVVIPVADGEVLFIKTPASGDRTYSGIGSGDTNYQVVDVADYEQNDENYWIAYRNGSQIYVRGYGELETGESTPISDPDKETILALIEANTSRDQQNSNIKLVEGGTYSLIDNAGTLELTLSEDAFAQIGEMSKARNTVEDQTISFPNATSVASIELLRTDGIASLRTVSVTDNDALTLTDDTYIFARRVDDGVLIGNSFLLKPGEFLELDGALSEIGRRLDQLKVRPETTPSTRITISGADITQLNGSTLSLEQRNLLLSFDGAVIDFETGEVFESDGTTPFLAGANDFTPFSIGSGEYFYYSVSLLPNAANVDNTISGQILVIPATASNVALANAPKAPFPGTGIKLANVYVQEDGASGLENITYSNIIALGVGGSGSGGSGDATSDETAYRDRLSNSTFEYANMNIASVDEDNQLDTSTATYDIPTGNFKFADSTVQELVSLQQLDSDFLAEELDVPQIELIALWDLDSIETAGTYEVSRDGGNEYQAVTMNRIGNSNTYRGILTFEEEAANAFNQEYAVANADDTLDLDDASAQYISQEFTVANTTVYKNVLSYLNKAAGAIGSFCVEIVRDDSGSPSLDPNDSMWVSAPQDIASLSTGDNVVNISSQFVLLAGDYHMIIKPDLAYRAAYTLNNADVLSVRIDSSAGPTPNLRTFNGTVYSAEVAGSTMVYRLEGRVLDLRVKITSAGTANDKFLSSYAVFYKSEDGIEFNQPTFRELFKFDGTVDNDNEFVLTNFLPDSRLLMCFAKGTGQVFRYGDFTLDGHKVVFPVNTFNAAGDVELEFFQIGSVDGVTANSAEALLTANHLGSTDAAIDRSVAGQGIFLRRPDGTLREIAIDNDDNIVIYSV